MCARRNYQKQECICSMMRAARLLTESRSAGGGVSAHGGVHTLLQTRGIHSSPGPEADPPDHRQTPPWDRMIDQMLVKT